ncbi:MAG: HAD family hydrolase [Candidatus Micrarchaeota archaeon]
MNYLVLLDRDGTINTHVGLVTKPEQLVLLPNAAKAIKLLNDHNIFVAIITNQSIVARNLCTEAEAEAINQHLVDMLAKYGAKIDAIYYCPHHPEKNHPEANSSFYRINCDCRKPKPGMLVKAAKHFRIAPENCFMVGDSTRDMLAGKNFGCKTILLRTGEGGKDGKYHVLPDYTSDNLYEAAKLIVNLIK